MGHQLQVRKYSVKALLWIQLKIGSVFSNFGFVFWMRIRIKTIKKGTKCWTYLTDVDPQRSGPQKGFLCLFINLCPSYISVNWFYSIISSLLVGTGTDLSIKCLTQINQFNSELSSCVNILYIFMKICFSKENNFWKNIIHIVAKLKLYVTVCKGLDPDPN